MGLALALALCPQSGALAQSAAPITVTPPTLRPERPDNGFRVEVPTTGALQAPPGSEGLSVTLGKVAVVGGLPPLAEATSAATARITGRRVSLAEIYAAASDIEAAYARAGYVLVRVSVPAQDLRDGGDLRIVVTDGFVEAVDLSGLPPRVRAAVRQRLRTLTGRHPVRLAEIERALLLANDVPGLTLHSTLARGLQPGGTRLLLDGTHKIVSGRIAVDNGLAASLDTYQASVQLQLNGVLGLGETIYGLAASGYDPGQWLKSRAPVGVIGGGFVLPVGDGRFSLNPEAIYSRTAPTPLPGAPLSLGTLRRLSLRAAYTLVRTRARQGSVTLGYEAIEEQNRLPQFDTLISHDRYMVLRAGTNWSWARPGGTGYGLSLQFSQGLGDTGAISEAQALASGIGFSRQGASNGFSRLSGEFDAQGRLGTTATLDLKIKGQWSFGKPLFRSEQFALEGPEAVSAYVGGVTAVDDGVTGRIEIAPPPWRLAYRAGGPGVAAYAFAAGGIGWIRLPTAVEPGQLKAAAVGLGARLAVARLPISASIELAHGLSDVAALNDHNRINASIAIRF